MTQDAVAAFTALCSQRVAPTGMSPRTCRCTASARSLKELAAQLDEAGGHRKGGGVSWEKIGRAFGISRQGAQKRWEAVSADERTPA
ncbi:hypothetical protein [Pseudarthrobacter sp. C4D7]|uniref:hypothetical protein n=1 Tax=Pseudarthrobacter sp. C4D7 TaxID=2735268 RepID=UPI0020C7BA5C|nr:hypothetical protein [Pseudarthrobacter sp. C4D7]